MRLLPLRTESGSLENLAREKLEILERGFSP